MMRRAAAALIVAALGLPSLGLPAHADDRRNRAAPRAHVEQRRAPEQRTHPAQPPTLERQQAHPDPRPAIGQRDRRERFDHRPPIPQRERVDNRPAVQHPRVENRSANQPPRTEHRPPFQPRRHAESRPASPPVRHVTPLAFAQPHDRFAHRPTLPPTNALLDRGRIAPASTFGRHDRQWHERRFADRAPDHWRGGHWRHGLYGGHVGWWWVIGPAWYLYPTPIYPYPDPEAPLLIVDAPDVCREFNGNAIVDDTGEPFYGTACLQPDGLWHIVMG